MYGHLDIINSSGKILRKRIELDYNNLEIFDFNVILLYHFMGVPSSSLIHRSTIDEYGMFNESIETSSDYELWLRYCLLHNCRLHLVPKTIGKYRIHSTQITIITRKERLENNNQIRKSTLEKLNPKDRLLYEKALFRYKKTRPFSLKFWFFVRNNIIFHLPLPISILIRIFTFIRSIHDRFKKTSRI